MFFFSFFLQKRITTEESDIQEIDRKVNEEINHYKEGIEKDIKEISTCMKHCKFEDFKVLMPLVDMGVVNKGASVSTTGKINPFSNIYFCEKNNLEVARPMKWKDIPVLPVPE